MRNIFTPKTLWIFLLAVMLALTIRYCASGFIEGFAIAERNERYTFINTNGQELFAHAITVV